MGEKKTKIVLDADVINHFVRGGETIIATEDISGISVHRSRCCKKGTSDVDTFRINQTDISWNRYS